ncbi:MAG: GxxExxY protein [Saprospiraceae bacterium]
MGNLIYKKEAYAIIGACMEVHRLLGHGLKESVYQDALEIEFELRTIPFEREKRYEVVYKGQVLKHYFVADFVCFGDVILELKAVGELHSKHEKQTLNYMAIAKSPLGLLVNFGEQSLRYKRFVL